MIFVLKIYRTLYRMLQIFFYKMMYGNSIKFSKGFRSRGKFSFVLDKGAEVTLGKDVFFNRNFSASVISGLSIGNNCIFGENVKIYDQNHIFKTKKIPIARQGFSSKKISIGNNCWVASNVTILKGVSIGDNVIIGANCLIYKDIPSNRVVTLKENLKIIERG